MKSALKQRINSNTTKTTVNKSHNRARLKSRTAILGDCLTNHNELPPIEFDSNISYLHETSYVDNETTDPTELSMEDKLIFNQFIDRLNKQNTKKSDGYDQLVIHRQL